MVAVFFETVQTLEITFQLWMILSICSTLSLKSVKPKTLHFIEILSGYIYWVWFERKKKSLKRYCSSSCTAFICCDDGGTVPRECVWSNPTSQNYSYLQFLFLQIAPLLLKTESHDHISKTSVHMFSVYKAIHRCS